MRILKRFKSALAKIQPPKTREYKTHRRSNIFVYLKSRKKILLYTDSRGINIPNQFTYDHYSTKLLHDYYVDEYLCPEKWTTILDFLVLWEKIKSNKYDSVILHAGIVDASPRHQQVALNQIYPEKKTIFDGVFGEERIRSYLHTDLCCDYEGDKTINLYSLKMAEEFLLPRLFEIPNLIWISSNQVNLNWQGNYWKDRPANIRMTEEYSRLFLQHFPLTINLLDAWNLDEVKLNTFDNIHPNKLGSRYIYSQLNDLLQSENAEKKGR